MSPIEQLIEIAKWTIDDPDWDCSHVADAQEALIAALPDLERLAEQERSQRRMDQIAQEIAEMPEEEFAANIDALIGKGREKK